MKTANTLIPKKDLYITFEKIPNSRKLLRQFTFILSLICAIILTLFCAYYWTLATFITTLLSTIVTYLCYAGFIKPITDMSWDFSLEDKLLNEIFEDLN